MDDSDNLRMKNYTNNNAFTLIELLVVISIITILMSIFIPVLGKARSTAMRLKCTHNLKQIDLTIEMYTNDYDNIYPLILHLKVIGFGWEEAGGHL